MEAQDSKVTFTLRLSEDSYKNCKAGMELDNSLSRNEYIEKAITYYSGYLCAEKNTEFFAKAISQTVEGVVKTSENRIARLLFKIAVEMGKLENMLAVINEMDEETIKRLHIRCVNEVKKINGIINMEDAVKYQRGED